MLILLVVGLLVVLRVIAVNRAGDDRAAQARLKGKALRRTRYVWHHVSPLSSGLRHTTRALRSLFKKGR